MKKNQIKYGVGIGPALRSRRVGALSTAFVELRRLIVAGADPRRLTIVPVERCEKCLGKGEFVYKDTTKLCRNCDGFKFKIIKPAADIEPMALNRDALTAEAYRFVMMSRPGTTATDPRNWLVKRTGEPSYLVRVFPEKYPFTGVIITCDCKAGKAGETCEHAEQIAIVDKRKFNTKGENENAPFK